MNHGVEGVIRLNLQLGSYCWHVGVARQWKGQLPGVNTECVEAVAVMLHMKSVSNRIQCDQATASCEVIDGVSAAKTDRGCGGAGPHSGKQ